MSKLKLCAKCGYLKEQCTCDKQEDRLKEVIKKMAMPAEMTYSIIQLTEIQLKVYQRFFALTGGNEIEARIQTLIFMQAMYSGQKKE